MIGILALQGGFEAHATILDRLGLPHQLVKLPRHLEDLDAVILPGGESTTILKLLDAYDLYQPLLLFGKEGRPVLGTCAGAILMCKKIHGREQRSFGWIPAGIDRNAYGSQRESFRAEQTCTPWELDPIPALFIRAPRFREVNPGVTVLSQLDGEITGVSYCQFTAVTYHPELGNDLRFHEAWYRRQVACQPCG